MKKKEKRDHWLEYADDEFDNVFINDVKAALKVLLLFVPLPVFWALFDQQVNFHYTVPSWIELSLNEMKINFRDLGGHSKLQEWMVI